MAIQALLSLDKHPDIAKALGEMVIAWARAENEMVLALSHATQMDANMTLSVYYRIPTFEARAKVIASALSDPDCQLTNRADVKKALEKLAKLAATRNKWVHGSYFTDGSDVFTFDFRKPHDVPRREDIKASDIEQHVTAVKKRTVMLQETLPTDALLVASKKKSQ